MAIEIATVLTKHTDDQFPSECRGKAIYGVELILLDADVTTIANRVMLTGEIKGTDVGILGTRCLDCTIILPYLTEYAQQYFADVLLIAEYVLGLLDANYSEAYQHNKALLFSISQRKLTHEQLSSSSESGMDVSIYENDTPLILASRMNYDNGIALLLEHGADINQPNKYGFTDVMAATYSGALRSLDYLLKQGARVDILDRDGKSALGWAIARKNTEAAKLLLIYGANFSSDDQLEEPWQLAVWYFDLATAYEELGRHNDAIMAYENACNLDPEEPTYLFALSNQYYAAHQDDKAKYLLEQAIMIQRSKDQHLH